MAIDASKQVVGTVSVPTNVTVEMVDHMIDTFLSGSRWYRKIRYPEKKKGQYVGEHIALGGHVIVTTDEGEKFTLDLEKFLIGYELYCKQTGEGVWDVYENGDADSADQIVQLALFGEVVYS